jgi:thiamine kinase-like enzyme
MMEDCGRHAKVLILIGAFWILLFILPSISAEHFPSPESEKSTKLSISQDSIQILKELRKKTDLYNEELEIHFEKPSINPESFYAEKIMFLVPKLEKNTNTCKHVAKIFKDLEDFSSERDDFKKIEQLLANLNSLNLTCQLEIPILVKFLGSAKVKNLKGEKKGIILLTKAEGKPLDNIYDHLGQYSPEEIQQMFFTIGKQMANFDRLVCQYTQNCKRFSHNDSHSGNLIYNQQDSQLYWIDYSGSQIQEISEDTPIPLLGGFESHESGYGFLSLLVNRISKPLASFSGNELIEKVSLLKAGTLAIKNFFYGYSENIGNEILAANIKKQCKIQMSLILKSAIDEENPSQIVEKINQKMRSFMSLNSIKEKPPFLSTDDFECL